MNARIRRLKDDIRATYIHLQPGLTGPLKSLSTLTMTAPSM